jgi:hypothetical protein
MNVNQKGSIGLIETIRDLTIKGYECFTPIHDYSPVDLIVMDKDFRPYKLQVKYRETFRGIIEVHFRSMVNSKSKEINFDAIDGWAVYCPEVNSVVYVSKTDVDLSKGSFAFRLEHGGKQVGANVTRRKLYTEYSELDEWFKSAPC